MFRLTLTSILLWLGLCTNGLGQSDDPDAIAQRFLAHMKANAPITGEFEVRGEYDPEIHGENLAHAARIEGAISVGVNPLSYRMSCRWSWDGVRELFERLETNTEVVAPTFFLGPEGYLHQGNPGRYSLRKPEQIGHYRPGSFYSSVSSGARWPDALQGKEFRSAPRSADEPAGTVWLIASDDQIECRLLIEEKTGVLHKVRVFADSVRVTELDVHSHIQSNDHRVFPEEAELRVYTPRLPDRPLRTESLRAKTVSFPRNQTETNRAMTLMIPKGSSLFDVELQEVTRLSAPIPARSVIEGRIPEADRRSFSPVSPNPEPLVRFREPESYTWVWWVAGVLGAALIAVLLVRRQLRPKPEALS